MNKGDNKVTPLMSKEDCLINITTCKSQMLNEDFYKFVVPSMTGLFQAIKGLSKAPDLASGVGSSIPRRLLHVDLFLRGEFTIQIHTFDINLMELEI